MFGSKKKKEDVDEDLFNIKMGGNVDIIPKITQPKTKNTWVVQLGNPYAVGQELVDRYIPEYIAKSKGRLVEIPLDPPLEEMDEQKKREFERRRFESVTPFLPWEPYHPDAKMEFVGSLFLPRSTLTRIISFCELDQVISCFFLVNRDFYESSLDLLRKMEFQRHDVKLLFGISSCISEALFLKILPNFHTRIKTGLFLETCIRTGDLNNQILHFCLLHRFQESAKYILRNNPNFLPRRSEFFIAFHDFNDETLFEMMKNVNAAPEPEIWECYVRCFALKRNLEALKYYKANFHDLKKVKTNPHRPNSKNFISTLYFRAHILVDYDHAKTNVEILRVLQAMNFFKVQHMKAVFIELVPLLPEAILVYFITAVDYQAQTVFHKTEAEAILRGIEVSSVLSRAEKKRLVDFIFYTTSQNKSALEAIRVGNEENEGEEEDVQQSEVDAMYKDRNINFSTFKMRKFYSFVHFYGRQGHETEFLDAVDVVDKVQAYSLKFNREGISEVFLNHDAVAKRIIQIRPVDLVDAVSNQKNEEFDALFMQFRYDPNMSPMVDDMDELFKLCISKCNNYAFRKLLGVETFGVRREVFNFTVRNTYSPELVEFLGKKYINFKKEGSVPVRKSKIFHVIEALQRSDWFEKDDGFIPFYKRLCEDPDFAIYPQLITRFDSSKQRKALAYMMKKWEPKMFKEIIDFATEFISMKKKRLLTQYVFKNKYWKDGYLLMLRIENKWNTIEKLDRMLPYMKKRLAMGCFHCGKELIVLEKKTLFDFCQNCSPKARNLRIRPLPVDVRDLEFFYCRQCCFTRTVEGKTAKFCNICAGVN